MLLFCHDALQSCDKDDQYGKRPSDALWKTEEEAASLTRFTLNPYCADVEKTAELAIFLYDAFTVDQSESMTSALAFMYDIMVEYLLGLFFGHTLSVICNRNFNRIVQYTCFQHYTSSWRSELTCIICNGIYHE